MKIFDAEQLHDWDVFTIKQQSISSLNLMERAAHQCTNYILNQKFDVEKIQIVCGKGNNGGDGLAIARQLYAAGIRPSVFIADWDEKERADFSLNLLSLQQTGTAIHFLKEEEDFTQIQKNGWLVEALFGYGLNRPLTGLHASLVTFINALQTNIISIDVPAGMFLNKTSKANTIINASQTLTFQSTKLCFLMAENADFFGDVQILPINLSPDFEAATEAQFRFTGLSFLKTLYKKRKSFSHKGTYGHALLVAGNEGKMGAAVMSATSCLRSGVGLLTCSIPKNDFAIIHTTIAEAMVLPRGQEGDVSKYSVVGCGPGLGTDDATVNLLQDLIQQSKNPMVLDADALNIISKNKEWLTEVPKKSILTPHPKEFDRLFGESETDFERVDKAVRAAKENDIVIVLKGTYTLVTNGMQNWFNSTGNNGMATGGSGDILTGLVTGLVSQKYDPFQAAVLAVFIHGLAADLCLADESYESLLPMDIVGCFGKAFKQLQK